MNNTLAPKNSGDILRKTFTIYKNNLFRFIAIVAIVAVPFAVVGSIFNVLLPAQARGSTEIMARGMFSLILVLAALVIFTLMRGAVIHAVAQQHFHRPVSIGQAYGFAWRRLGAMFGAEILYGLVIFGILWVATFTSAIIFSIITFSIGVNSGPQVAFVIAGTMVLIATPPALYLGIKWSFMFQTALLEGCGPMSALSRSWALVKGSWWWVLGIVLLLLTIVSIIGMIFYAPNIIFYTSRIIDALNQSTTGFIPYTTTEPTSWIIIAASIWALVGSIILRPIFTTGMTLLYFDLRVRKQGYSLDTLANELGLSSPTTDIAATSPPE